MQQPEHACALLVDERGWLVLQLRPSWARHAAGLITCYGGKLEAGETVAGCLQRELTEETGWRPALVPDSGVDLRCGARFIACFVPLQLPADIEVRSEPGFIAVRAAQRTLPALPLSPWHQAVIDGWYAGQTLVEVQKPE